MRGCLAYRGYGHGRGRRFCSDASLSPCRLRFRAFALRSAQSSIFAAFLPGLFTLGIRCGHAGGGVRRVAHHSPGVVGVHSALLPVQFAEQRKYRIPSTCSACSPYC